MHFEACRHQVYSRGSTQRPLLYWWKGNTHALEERKVRGEERLYMAPTCLKGTQPRPFRRVVKGRLLFILGLLLVHWFIFSFPLLDFWGRHLIREGSLSWLRTFITVDNLLGFATILLIFFRRSRKTTPCWVITPATKYMNPAMLKIEDNTANNEHKYHTSSSSNVKKDKS